MKRITVKKDTLILDDEEVLKGVVVGKNGCSSSIYEGAGKTPLGLYKLGFAFGTKDIKTKYPYYKITDNVYWVDDVTSPYYNNWVSIDEEPIKYPYSYMQSIKEITFKSAEHLISYRDAYELAFVILYNTNPIIKNKGSAIFFHVKTGDYTAGCIATSKENLEYILNWLDGEEAEILIDWT